MHLHYSVESLVLVENYFILMECDFAVVWGSSAVVKKMFQAVISSRLQVYVELMM